MRPVRVRRNKQVALAFVHVRHASCEEPSIAEGVRKDEDRVIGLAVDIEKRIRAERGAGLRSLGLPAEWIAPDYAGRSIVNVPASIVTIFGGQMSTAPLDSRILQGMTTDIERIVLVVVDALGYDKLKEALATNPQNGFHRLLSNGARLVPLTSVFPSTTTAALTSLCTGYTPAEHGFLGFQLFLREYGVRANMIEFSPVVTQDLGRDQLLAGGLATAEFLATPSLPQLLGPLGAPFYYLLALPYIHSGLSKVQIRGAKQVRGIVSSSDLWVVLREWIQEHRAERAVFAAYWSGLDAIEHYYGPSSETATAEIDNLAYSFEREFLLKLSPAARRGTLFMLTADHGQIDTPLQHSIYLRDHPGLCSHLLMDFAGEPRAAYLYCRQGEKDAAREYLAGHFAEQFFVVDSQAALEAGLFGAGTPAPEARYRIGDWIVLPRADHTLVESRDAKPMPGRHGGLTPGEMLVPLMAGRLD